MRRGPATQRGYGLRGGAARGWLPRRVLARASFRVAGGGASLVARSLARWPRCCSATKCGPYRLALQKLAVSGR